MQKIKMAVGFVLISGAIAIARQMPMPMNAGDIKWDPAPNILPRGAQIAVVSGNPSKDALYVVRLKMPSNYEIPAHRPPDFRIRDCHIRRFPHRYGGQAGPSKGPGVTGGRFCRGVS